MFKITNIESLGTEYTVADTSGKIVDSIQIIPHTEILDAALGEFSELFTGIGSYLEQSISVLAGNENIDQYSVLWYATHDNDVVLSELIEYAVKHGYNKIILEHLEDIE